MFRKKEYPGDRRDFEGTPPPPPHEMGKRDMTLIKLDDAKDLYLLLVNQVPPTGPGKDGRSYKPFLPWIGIISMVISLIYSSVNKKLN